MQHSSMLNYTMLERQRRGKKVTVAIIIIHTIVTFVILQFCESSNLLGYLLRQSVSKRFISVEDDLLKNMKSSIQLMIMIIGDRKSVNRKRVECLFITYSRSQVPWASSLKMSRGRGVYFNLMICFMVAWKVKLLKLCLVN